MSNKANRLRARVAMLERKAAEATRLCEKEIKSAQLQVRLRNQADAAANFAKESLRQATKANRELAKAGERVDRLTVRDPVFAIQHCEPMAVEFYERPQYEMPNITVTQHRLVDVSYAMRITIMPGVELSWEDKAACLHMLLAESAEKALKVLQETTKEKK